MGGNLIVGSVFVSDEKIQEAWLDLQLKFLRETTDKFEHVVFLWNEITGAFRSKTNIVFSEGITPNANPSDSHRIGLSLLLDLFRQKENDFENFLFLDSDAFPIRKNWLPRLVSRMSPQLRMSPTGGYSGKTGKNYDIAVAVRAENLETRLHASVLFARKQALKNIQFEMGTIGKDMLGVNEWDVHVPYYQFEHKDKAFPLMRSNKINVHPLACGVYYNMFYHHCCGSRTFIMRANSYWKDVLVDASSFTNQIMAKPFEFVGNLAGWTPNKYPQTAKCKYL